MARILIHTLVFSPDGVSTSVLISELAQDLKRFGHEITVLTTKPHYNRDVDAESRQPLHKRLGGLYYVSDYHGMRVIHTHMPRKGEGVGNRIRDYLIFHILSLFIGVFSIGRQDVIFAPSPPLTIGVIGWLLALLKGGKLVYNVQELYPEVAVQMGVMRENSRSYRVFHALESFVYRRSHTISVIAETFRQYIINRDIEAQKITVIPNFVDADFIQPGSKDNPLAREHGLVDKFVVFYAGNIGMTQSFDTIIEVIKRLQDNPDIHFLIVGAGSRRLYLEKQIDDSNLSNITLLPYQPRSVVPDIYATGDLGLVPLMAGTARTTIPSKIYTIMASGRPALASVDDDSELVYIVEQAKCGVVVPPDKVDAMDEAIRQAYAEREQYVQYGKNGRAYIEAHYTRSAIATKYDELFKRLVN